jgi:hypothetical protein
MGWWFSQKFIHFLLLTFANPSAHSFFVNLWIISSLRKLEFFWSIPYSPFFHEQWNPRLRSTWNNRIPHCFSSLGSFCCMRCGNCGQRHWSAPGAESWGYPTSSKLLDNDLVFKPMVTWGSPPFFKKIQLYSRLTMLYGRYVELVNGVQNQF